MLLLVACGHRDDAAPPSPLPAPISAVGDRVACDHPGPVELDGTLLRCRELPFDLALEPGFVRTDETTITTLAKSFSDGSQWQVKLQPMLETPTAQQLSDRVDLAARAVEPQATLAVEPAPLYRQYTAPGGRLAEARGGMYDGYLVTLAVAGMPGSETSPPEQRGARFLAAIRVRDRVSQAIAPGPIAPVPVRAWRFTQVPPHPDVELRGELYALPDLQATLGIRELRHTERCAQLADLPATAFVESLALGSLTLDKVDRIAGGIRATTSDARPAAFVLLCRDTRLVQIQLRAPVLSPQLLALLDELAR